MGQLHGLSSLLARAFIASGKPDFHPDNYPFFFTKLSCRMYNSTDIHKFVNQGNSEKFFPDRKNSHTQIPFCFRTKNQPRPLMAIRLKG